MQNQKSTGTWYALNKFQLLLLIVSVGTMKKKYFQYIWTSNIKQETNTDHHLPYLMKIFVSSPEDSGTMLSPSTHSTITQWQRILELGELTPISWLSIPCSPILASRAGHDVPALSCRTNPGQGGQSCFNRALKAHYPVGLLRFLLSSASPSSHLSGTGLRLGSSPI